jgi:hypothetical protein
LAAVTTRAAAAAEAGGDAGSVPAGSVPKAGVTSSEDPRAAAQTSAVLAAAAGVPNSAGATAAAAAADPKGIVAAAAAAAADAAAAVTGVGVNPSAVAAMVAGAAADSAGSSAITALLQQEAEKAALVKETRHAHNARVSQAHAHVTAAAAQQQQHQQREAESLSIQYQQQVLIQQQQIQMQQLALEASQNAAAAQLAQAQLAHVSNMQNVEIAKADQRAEFAAQMLREGAPVSDEGADMLASIQQRQQEALARSAGDGMSMFASVRSGNRINLPDVVTDAMMGDTVSDVVLSSGIDFGDDDELKADVKKAAMSTNNNGRRVYKKCKTNCNTKDILGQSVGQFVGAHRRDRIPRGKQNPGRDDENHNQPGRTVVLNAVARRRGGGAPIGGGKPNRRWNKRRIDSHPRDTTHTHTHTHTREATRSERGRLRPSQTPRPRRPPNFKPRATHRNSTSRRVLE